VDNEQGYTEDCLALYIATRVLGMEWQMPSKEVFEALGNTSVEGALGNAIGHLTRLGWASSSVKVMEELEALSKKRTGAEAEGIVRFVERELQKADPVF
jgi:hypothetical protein